MKVRSDTYVTLCRLKKSMQPNGKKITFDDVIGLLVQNQQPERKTKKWVDDGPAFAGFGFITKPKK